MATSDEAGGAEPGSGARGLDSEYSAVEAVAATSTSATIAAMARQRT